MNESPHRRPCCDGREPSGGTPPQPLQPGQPAELRINGASAVGDHGAPVAESGARTNGGSDRRGFLFGIGSALMGVGGVLAALPIVGSLFAPARRMNPNAWTDLGPTSEFPDGTTRLASFTNPRVSPTDGQAAVTACWVRSLGEGKFQIFAVNCAHLGCPVRWFEQSKLFMCPCHGGVYYEDGSRASGPPPRGLFPYEWRITAGRLEIEAGRLPGLQEGT